MPFRCFAMLIITPLFTRHYIASADAAAFMPCHFADIAAATLLLRHYAPLIAYNLR